MDEYTLSDLDLLRESQGAMILWALAKQLNFMGSADLKLVIVEKANVKLRAATARPVHPKELLLTFGLKQVEDESAAWTRRLQSLQLTPRGEELNTLLNALIKEEVLLRDTYQCYACGTPLSLSDASLHHIFWDKGVMQNVSSNLITYCRKCHDSLGCGEKL